MLKGTTATVCTEKPGSETTQDWISVFFWCVCVCGGGGVRKKSNGLLYTHWFQSLKCTCLFVLRGRRGFRVISWKVFFLCQKWITVTLASLGYVKSTSKKSMQLHTLGSVRLSRQNFKCVITEWRTAILFSGHYALTAEHRACLLTPEAQSIFLTGISGWACSLHARVRQSTAFNFNAECKARV